MKKKIIIGVFIGLPLALIMLSLLLVVAFKWIPVPITPIMVKEVLEHRKDDSYVLKKKWVSLEDISPEMIKAVITSEDQLFCEHDGFDREQIRQALEERRKGKRIRGASTISQQTAKNVFTLHGRTMFRKGVECWFTILIEKIWGKERIMEVYLNIAETGNGIYGVEAAAQQYFGKSAAKLNRREASAIAVCLPAPKKRNPAKPSEYVRKRISTISGMIPNLIYPDWVEHKVINKAETKGSK